MEKETLYRFFKGSASYEEEEQVCNWVESAPENQEELIKERKIFDLMLIQSNGKMRTVRNEKRFRLSNLIKYAAIFTLLIICGVQFYQIRQSSADDTMNTITVPSGQRVNITLADGTNVWLNAGTKMKYPASFSKKERKISLEGEGYFEVTQDEEKPFIVETEKYAIRVLGTKFNVEAYNNSFSTALMEGSVQITANTDPSEKIILKPRQIAELIDRKLQTNQIQDYEVYRWKEGLLCFENISFNELMKQFEKTYGMQIINENKNLDNYICSGKFRISDGINFILHVLQRDVKFQFQRNENNTIIYIK